MNIKVQKKGAHVSVNVFMHQLSMCIARGMYLIETSACLDCLQSIISCRHVVSHASQASHSASAQMAFSKTQKITHHLERQFSPYLDAGRFFVSWILCRNHWSIIERGVPIPLNPPWNQCIPVIYSYKERLELNAMLIISCYRNE